VTFILDTNVLSTFQKKKPHPAVLRWMARIGWGEIATTVVTVTEIQRGIERARAHHPAAADQTEEWLTGMLAAGEPQIFPMNVEAARLLARMYETPALRHFVITDPKAKDQATGSDLATAAIAISVNAIIATNNVKHFLQIHAAFKLPGLFDPFNQSWHVQPETAESSVRQG
jgi:predicted nucleic acid-binding protein